jgi:HTH-type transcriptional regulator / antitoxin HigA
MTLTIDQKRYGELLCQYLPRVIKTEAENEAFLAIVEELMHRAALSLEEEAVLELLVNLIEEFETKHYALNASTPRSRLLHLMEAQNLQTEDLVTTLGSLQTATAIVAGQSDITPEQAIALSKLLHVKPELLAS